MCRTFPLSAALLLLFCLLAGGLRADPITGPAVEQHGLRFESWLASPKIAIPRKTVDYHHCTATMLFSVRVTNLTQHLVRFNPFAASLNIVKPNGEDLLGWVLIAGSIRSPQEKDYIMLLPSQSLVVPYRSHFYWHDNHLCLDWPSMIDHPVNYSKIVAGSYHFVLDYRMPSQTVPIQDDRTRKIIKTLNGFWTGDVTVSSMTFEVTEPLPAVLPQPVTSRR
jgi:hypothetical protein